jgi:hypothetical protein
MKHSMPSSTPIAKLALSVTPFLTPSQQMVYRQIYYAYNGAMLSNQMELENVVLALMVPSGLHHGYDNSPKHMHLALSNPVCICSLLWQLPKV